MASRKRTALSLAKKLKIIEAVEKGDKSRCDVAKEFLVAKSTVSLLCCKKSMFRKAVESQIFCPHRKKNCGAKHKDIEEALLLWFKQARTMNVPISGPILQAKAKELALVLGHCEFHCSSGWLECFKARNNIAFRRMCGESFSETPEMTSDWLSQTLPSLLAEYKPNNIFNADETGLFWKYLPDKTMSFKGDTCSGGKRSKERITVMVCASMIGEKVPLLVIGKFKNPRCFKNVRSLPITYKANTRAWMVSELLTSWIIDLESFSARIEMLH